MNTNIYLWVEPMVINHERTNERYHFNCIVEGDHIKEGAIDTDTLDKVLEGKVMDDIMDFAGIDANWNYASISAKLTKQKPKIYFAESPTKTKQKKEVAKVVSGKKDLTISKKNMEIKDDGKISLSIPALGVSQTIDFKNIWEQVEKNFLGKIKEGDSVTLTNDAGEVLFEIRGGSFLNAGIGDITVSTKQDGIKGGLFIRNDGSLDIGDMGRTFHLKIHTDKLLKTSLKLNKELMDIVSQKLLK